LFIDISHNLRGLVKLNEISDELTKSFAAEKKDGDETTASLHDYFSEGI